MDFMTGYCPNAHRTLMQHWECLKRENGARWGFQGQKVFTCPLSVPKLSSSWFNIYFFLNRDLKKRCPFALPNHKITRCTEALFVNIWPLHPWVESVYHWHFASRKCDASTNWLIYRLLSVTFLPEVHKALLKMRYGQFPCVWPDSWILLIIIIENWTWWPLKHPWKWLFLGSFLSA